MSEPNWKSWLQGGGNAQPTPPSVESVSNTPQAPQGTPENEFVATVQVETSTPAPVFPTTDDPESNNQVTVIPEPTLPMPALRAFAADAFAPFSVKTVSLPTFPDSLPSLRPLPQRTKAPSTTAPSATVPSPMLPQADKAPKSAGASKSADASDLVQSIVFEPLTVSNTLDTAVTLESQLRRAYEILDTLPSIRYVALDEQGRPATIEAQWPSLYDYYLEQYNIETPLSLQVLKQQLEQARGNEQALRLLNVQLIETLTLLTAALDDAQQVQSSFWTRLFRSDPSYNEKNVNLTYSTAISAMSVLCTDSEETLASLQPATCQLKFQ